MAAGAWADDNNVTAYNPPTGRWATLVPRPQGRQAFGAAAVGDVAYLLGGAPLCGRASTGLLALTVP